MASRKNYKDGKEDGVQTHWNESGEKVRKENYKEGKKEGLFQTFYMNGKKESEVTYKDDRKVEGSWKYWDVIGKQLPKEEANRIERMSTPGGG